MRNTRCALVTGVHTCALPICRGYDSFGHAAGDFALMETAKRLAGSIRATDVAARIGGDEFGLILDQSSEDGARAQVTRLCDVQIGRAACRERVCRYV